MKADRFENMGHAEPTLPGLVEAFADVGVDSLPLGVAALSRRERTFLIEYLRTGTATEAARRAGYSMPESNASKLLKNTGIARCLAHAGVQVARNVDQLVLRASERSRALHALFCNEVEKRAEMRDENKICRLAAAAERTDVLLGSLVGKIGSVRVAIAVNHHQGGNTMLSVPASALPALNLLRGEARAVDSVAIEVENY